LFASTAESLASVGTALTVAGDGKIAVGAQNDHKTERFICVLSDAKPVVPTTRQIDWRHTAQALASNSDGIAG